MTEYIDKGIAINIIKMTDHTGYSIECVTDITDLVVKAIKEMPTADVAPVVHGEWIDKGEDYMIRWTCSNCGRRDTHIYDFCPDCGADMRGGTE